MASRKKVVMTIAPNSIRKLSGLKADGSPNAHWRKFKERIEAFEQIPLNEWKEEEILGYLLKRYSDHYQIPFSLSYSGAPTKCSEMYCIRRMLQTIGTEEGEIAKEYIDWVWDKIIIPQKMPLESLGFFFTQKLCNQFKVIFHKNRTITRSTELPNEYKDIVNTLGISVDTYGDLAFAKMALEKAPERQDLLPYSELFSKLKTLGFSDRVLDNLQG